METVDVVQSSDLLTTSGYAHVSYGLAHSPNLTKKLAKVLGEVGYIQKDGYNDYHKYSFVTEGALTSAVRTKLSEAGIFVFTSVEEVSESKDSMVFVTTLHTFVDGETGETFAVKSQGQAQDKKGDKALYKAITGAMKYFIYKNFLIPTGDDPEETRYDVEREEPVKESRREAKKSTPAKQESKEHPDGGPYMSDDDVKKIYGWAKKNLALEKEEVDEVFEAMGISAGDGIPSSEAKDIRKHLEEYSITPR